MERCSVLLDEWGRSTVSFTPFNDAPDGRPLPLVNLGAMALRDLLDLRPMVFGLHRTTSDRHDARAAESRGLRAHGGVQVREAGLLG